MKKNRDTKPDPANQSVDCGAEMPEGDHVCKGCRDSAVYHHALNVRITTEQMDAIDRACIQKGLRISEVVRGALDAWMKDRLAHQERELQEDELQSDARDWLNPHRIDVPPGFDSGRGI